MESRRTGAGGMSTVMTGSADSEGRAPVEYRYLADAENRLTRTIRSSLALFAVIAVFSVAFLYLTQNHAAAPGADAAQRAMRRWLVVAAALAYGGGRAAVRIRNAKAYVAASRRALEEFQERAQSSDEDYTG